MKKKRKAMALWKVILITISSIIGLIGVTVLALYIRGDFNDNPVYPESGIFFVLDGNEKYNSELNVIETSESFSLTLSTSTEDVNRRTVNLSLPTGTHATVRENGYLDNGIIRVPETVQLDRAFNVELSVSPTDNHIAGGLTSITATSTYPTINPVTISVNVDVPVEEITAYCYDAEDASEAELNDIFVGSYFKVGLNYSPERSENVFGREESKYVFYYFTRDNIEFDYITKTFHATRVSEGSTDEITLFVFSNSQYEKDFLNQFDGNPEEFVTEAEYSEFNTEAINYMLANSGSYRTATISDITVKEVSVSSFVVSNENFNAKVDKKFNLAINSTLPEFDGNLGVVIRDEEDNILNSVYAGGVGIALSSNNTNNNRIILSGGEVLKVTIDATGHTDSINNYSYEFSYDEEGNLSDTTIERLTSGQIESIATSSTGFMPTLPNVTSEGEEVQIIYYFFLPSRNVGGTAGNYNYSLSSDSQTTADFIVALFLEREGEYELFLAEEQEFETLSHITVTFENSVESDISWQEGTDILRIIYDSDSKLSDSVELSELINLPSENVYQTTRYFLMFEGGGQMPAEFNAISLGNGYTYQNGTDFNIGGLPSGDIYLYELPSSNLTALSGYDNTLYLVFATVRTNADGELVLQEDDGTWKYSIMMISDIKSLEIEATIPLNEINKTLVLTSSVNEAYLDNNQILLPSVLTSEDSFRFNITIEERRDQLLNLYNAGDLKIEFRETSTGEVADYIVTSSDITISDTGFSGDIVVYESFNNVEGVNLTPYLIYNNGKRVQESAVNVEYGGARQSFTLYKQSVASAEYAFMANEEQAMTYPTDELSPINVIFNLEGQTITWPDETDSIAIEGLNNRLSVILYDTKGKIIRTNVASYNLSEVPITGDRVITITNNAITQFLSTDGRVITTTVQATYRNAGMTESASLAPIYFTVQSEGVSSIWYDPTDGVPSQETIYEEWDIEDGGTITIEKYLTENDFILMDNLVIVKRDGEDGEEPVDVTSTLNRADMTGFDTSDLESLFVVDKEVIDGSITNGIIILGNENASSTDNINGSRVESYTDPIYSFAMISALARDVRLVFDITDESGLVNLKLELILKQNIDYSPLLETYANEKGYSDYLLYGDNDEVRVFGGEGSDEDPEDPFSLDEYLPIHNIRNANEERPLLWAGNLHVSSQRGIIVGTGSTPTNLGGSRITFKDVTSKEIGSVTFYYKGYNPYGLSIMVDFVLSPNYAYVQRNDYVNLSSLTDTDSPTDTDLSSYYVLCRATDLIDYIRSGADGDGLPVLEKTELAFTYSPEDGSLITLSDNTLSRTKESFSAQLGATIENNISLVLKENDAVSEEDAFALMFNEGENGYVNNGYVNSLPFRVGYGKSGSAGVLELIDEIFGHVEGETRNYSVLATSDGYELVLLENTQYELDGWMYEYQGSGIQGTTNKETIRVQNLSSFNINGVLTFTNNTITKKTDKIIVDTRLTRIGLEYVVYSENYPYDIITGNMNDLVENDIREDISAGQNVLKIIYFNTSDASDEDLTEPGFHLLQNNENDTTTGYNLQVEAVTEGYEDLITIIKTSDISDINDAIKLNSMIDLDVDVFAVLKLTLTMTVSGGQQLSNDIYYRIRIVPNYSFESDVTYPYNGTAEYVTDIVDGKFNINFKEEFTSQNASLSVVGKTRFPSVINIEDESVVEGLNYIYTIESVTVNDEELFDYSNYLTFNLENNEIPNGELKGTLTELGRDAIIQIKVTRTIEDVANSAKTYTLIINNAPTYDPTVRNLDGGDLDSLTQNEDGNFEDNVTIGTYYSYSITLLQNEGEIQTPVISGVNAHITSVGGEKYLKPFLRETSDDNPINAYTSTGPTTIPNTSDNISDFADMTVQDLVEDVVIGEATLSASEYKEVTTEEGATYYIRNDDIRYFTFTQDGSQYNLYFTTVSEIEEDAVFSIGIYTEYTNVFDIFFNLDGGYDIEFRDELSGSFESGNDYSISSFITSITQKGEQPTVVNLSDIEYEVTSITTASNVVYDNASETFVASDFIVITEDSKVFRVTGFNEDFTANIKATINGIYSFTFNINFTRSYDNTVIRQDSSLTIYAQDSNILEIGGTDISDALSIFDPRQYVNDGVEGEVGLAEIDEFTFSNNDTQYEFTAENVAEAESFVLDLTLNYIFNDKTMFTFTIMYNYEVQPNVALHFNYPNPQNLATTNFTSEYVDNNETIDNYFNSAPKFSKPNDKGRVDNRVSIEKIGQGEYYYDIAIYVDEINNAVLTVDNTTISSAGLVGSVTNRTGDMPNYSFTFRLNNLSQVGTIAFSIVVNEVTDYYYVTINNNNVVTVETNATNLVENNYERIYVEDIAGATDSYLYSLDRMLKYEFNTGASGSYYLRFENGTENFIHSITVEDTGIVVVEDMGASYSGYSLQGVYNSENDALNMTNAITNTSTIFLQVPYLTNRIVLRYAGYEVAKEVASIYLQEGDVVEEMETVAITNKIETKQTQNILYKYSYESGRYKTNATFTTLLTVKFEVTSSVQNHYEEIITGQQVSLLSLSGFGILNAETGETYTASEIQANNAYLTLQIYGFRDNEIKEEDLLNLHEGLKNGTATVAQGQRFDMGLIPRYGMELNGNSGSITSNFLTLTSQGTAQRPNNYTIYAQGAGNIGNFVAMKLTYTTVIGENPYSKSADLLFKVLPAYQVEFTAESASGGTIYGNDMTIGDKNYSTNSSNNPFNIINADTNGGGTGNGQYYLYSTATNVTPVLRVYRTNGSGTVTNSTNLSNRFTYTFNVNAESGYNTYDTTSTEGLRLNNWKSTDNKVYTAKADLTAPTISFTAYSIDLGARYYYIDAVDSFGFNIRFYIAIRAAINPTVQEVNTYDVNEGDIIQVGAQYRLITLQQGRAVADHGKYETEFNYYYAYDLQNVSGENAPTISPKVGAIRYYYIDGNGESYLTDSYQKVKENWDATNNSAILYIGEPTISEDGTFTKDGTFTVRYNKQVLSPLHSDSEYINPTFNTNVGGLNITLSGFEAYMYNKTEEIDAIPYIEGHSIFGDHISNVNDVEISSITFEYNGENVGKADGYFNSEQYDSTFTSNSPSNKLITAERYMINNEDDLVIGYSAIDSEDNQGSQFKIPTLPGYLYGTDMVIDGVTMVIRLEKIGSDSDTDYAELRINLNISRSQATTLTTTNFTDTQEINRKSFTNNGNEVYNDTLEIVLEPGAEVSYAITKDTSTPTSFTTISNNRNYTHVEYVRISSVGLSNAVIDEDRNPINYYIHINSSELPSGVTFRYGQSEISFDYGNRTNAINIGTIEDNNITLRVESASELNSQNYTTRRFYTLIKEGEEFYHSNHSVRLYTLANSITTTDEFGVGNYYRVSGDNGTYYVISASEWARDGNLEYSVGSGGTNNSYPINSRPYYYSYSISTDGSSARGASVDSMGTVTTGTTFNINTNYIEIDVTLHVAGADGLFEDEVGIELGTVRFHLNAYSEEKGRLVTHSGSGIYTLEGNALVTLNDGETVTAFGFGDATVTAGKIETNDSKTIVVPAGEQIYFADYFNSTRRNSSFRIVKESESGKYSNWNNEDSYTYSTAQQYQSIIVESYVNDTTISYSATPTTVIAYNDNNVQYKALAVGTDTYNQTLAFLGGTVYLAEDVEKGVFGDEALSNGANVTKTSLNSSEAKVETVNVISVYNGTVTYYEITLFFYTAGESYDYDVALTTRTNYDLFSLFTDATSIYSIDSENNLINMRNESLTETAYSMAERTYYVVDASGKVTQNNVKYYIYNSTENEDRLLWYHDAVTREEVIASMLKEEYSESTSYDESNYKLYQLASNNAMTMITNGEIDMGTLDDNRANINFLLETPVDEKVSYRYYIFTFYYYNNSATFDVATNYSSGYALSNLNELIINHFGLSMVGSANWYVFEAGDIVSQSVIELSASTAINGVINKDFYVNINDTYYQITINFHCSLGTYTDTITTQSSVIVSDLQDKFNEILGNNGVTITSTGAIYQILDDNSIGDALSESVTPPRDYTSAMNGRFLYNVNNSYYIFNITILKDKSVNITNLDSVFRLNSVTSGENGEVSLLLSSVRAEIASKLNILQRNLVLSTGGGENIVTPYSFTPLEPIINYDYFFIKLIAEDSSNPDFEATIYILATNTINLGTNNLNIIINNFSGTAISDTLKEKINAGLGLTDVVSSKLYLIENDRTTDELTGLSVASTTFVLRKEFYYEAENSAGIITRAVISATIVGYPTADVIGEENIVNVDYSVVYENGTVKLSFDKDILHSRLSAKIGTTVDSVTGLTRVDDNYQVEISGDGDYAFMVKALVNSQTGTPEERNVIILAFNVEVG